MKKNDRPDKMDDELEMEDIKTINVLEMTLTISVIRKTKARPTRGPMVWIKLLHLSTETGSYNW